MSLGSTPSSHSAPSYGTAVGSYDYADFTLVSPVEGSTGNDRRTNIVVEYHPAADQQRFPGNTYLYPHIPSMRQDGTALLRSYPDLTSTVAPADGFGLLYTTVDDTAGGALLNSFPCTVDFEPGWGLAEAAESAGRAVRLRLNPYPGGVNINELPGGKQIFVRLAQTLPSVVVEY